MEDEILIKGKVNAKTRSKLLISVIILLAICISIALYLTFTEFDAKRYYGGYWSEGFYHYITMNGWEVVSDTFFDTHDYVPLWENEMICSTSVMILFASLLASIVLFIIYLKVSKCSIEITENNVRGKTYFGRDVVLPIYKISSFSTKKRFSKILIATSSTVTIDFALVENYEEVGQVLSQLVGKKQQSTQASATPAQPKAKGVSAENAPEMLARYKALLDSGAITEEEYNAKKKELLGL